METNLITLNSTMPTFKNSDLNKATAKLYELAGKQASATSAYEKTTNITRKAVASVLADIEARKLYKEDGLKSLAEYGDTIGLDKSLTHKLENAGRLLNSEDATIKDFAGKADWSKLSILASADQKEVAEAIKDKKLTPESTQREVKDWKSRNEAAKPKAGKVLPEFEVDLTVFDRNGAKHFHFDRIAIEGIEQLDGFHFANYKDESGNVIYFGIHSDGRMARYTRVRVKAESTPKTKSIDLSSMTDEEIMAEMARRKAERAKK